MYKCTSSVRKNNSQELLYIAPENIPGHICGAGIYECTPPLCVHIHPGRSLPIIPVLYPLMEGIKTALLLLLLNIREGGRKKSVLLRGKKANAHSSYNPVDRVKTNMYRM